MCGNKLSEMDIGGKLILRLLRRIKRCEISGMRASYNDKSSLFLEEDLEIKEPLYLFDKWFKIVKSDPRTVEPNAMCLSTATK